LPGHHCGHQQSEVAGGRRAWRFASNSILLPLSQGGARLDKLLGQVHDLLPDPTLPDGVGVVVGPTKPATRHTLAQPRASLPSPSLSVLSEFKGSLACDAAHTSTAARLTAVALALGSLTLTRCRHTTRPSFPNGQRNGTRTPAVLATPSASLVAHSSLSPLTSTHEHGRTHSSCPLSPPPGYPQ
jgi:hypothetical protein